MKKQRVIIVGAGITGIMTAYVLHYFDPTIDIQIIDAGPEPKLQNGSEPTHYGTTLGVARDARHFTGTEGLSFQNPIHTTLLFQKAHKNSEGWQTIPEKELSIRERSWRQECLERYNKIKGDHNLYDQMYTTLNYAGMSTWEWLSEVKPNLAHFRINHDHVYVAFSNEAALLADLKSETSFNPFQKENPICITDLETIHEKIAESIAVKKIFPRLLKLPGTAWRIKSLWDYLYHFLRNQPSITFIWNSVVVETKSLPEAEVYVWAAGSTYPIPDMYKKYGRVQGIGGWWITIPNLGFKLPFKFSAPQPSGYINFTPDGNVLHISGGFGWVGERQYKEAQKLLEPAKKHFLNDVANFLNIPERKLNKLEVDCCIRPTTPTGLPDIATYSMNGKQHLMISGAGKAGSTQAPLLALHVAKKIGLGSKIKKKLESYTNKTISKVIVSGLDLLDQGFEPKT